MNKLIGAFLIIFAIASGQTHAIAHEDMRSLLKSTVDKPGRVKFSLKEYSLDETKSFIGNSFPRHLVLRVLSRNSHRPNETWKSFLTDPESGLGAESFYAQFCSLHDKLMPVKISYRNRSPRTVQINLKNLYNNPFYTPFDLTDLKQKYPTPTPGVARLCKGLMTSLILCGSMLGLLPSIVIGEVVNPALGGFIAAPAILSAMLGVTLVMVKGDDYLSQKATFQFLNNLTSIASLDEEKGAWQKMAIVNKDTQQPMTQIPETVELKPDQRLEIILLTKRPSLTQHGLSAETTPKQS